MFDFTHAPNRRGSDSIKWRVAPGELPMWIADMDFATAPSITAALTARLADGAYGYETPGPAYAEAVCTWFDQQHGVALAPEACLFAAGVMPTLGALIRALTPRGSGVLVQAPVYNLFFGTIEATGRQVVRSDLRQRAGRYAIDWTDLTAKLAAPTTTMMIVCNPHNPIGQVWDKATLARIAALCQAHDVLLVADEIHGDLVLSGTPYVPIASVTDQAIALVSPSKTFNLAGLHAATAIVPDVTLRAQVAQALATYRLDEPNLLAVPGTIAAYTTGGPWLAALKDQLRTNIATTRTTLAQTLPALRVVPPAATYLMWLDVSAWHEKATVLADQLRAATGLIVSAGDAYRGDGNHYLRLNIACPPNRLADGLARLARGLNEPGEAHN
ncbi:MalY/PatB family protein [Lacticaseibacillus daqingensis]|uniref:MalY/PatB family protein n=1 Tax=Lacticaseibacillus daqingensis TaxID=2486014 RepID=UPI000F78A68B|nr:PatB family C-S lyase [Lacticaseibacillus daqingensis]